MLESLHSQFELLAKDVEAEPSEIVLMRSRFVDTPEDYFELMRKATNIEMEHKNGAYLRIFSPCGCLEMDESYSISRHIPAAIPIGDDGGCNILFYMVGKENPGLYCVSLDDVAPENATLIARNLRALLIEERGIEEFRYFGRDRGAQ